MSPLCIFWLIFERKSQPRTPLYIGFTNNTKIEEFQSELNGNNKVLALRNYDVFKFFNQEIVCLEKVDEFNEYTASSSRNRILPRGLDPMFSGRIAVRNSPNVVKVVSGPNGGVTNNENNEYEIQVFTNPNENHITLDGFLVYTEGRIDYTVTSDIGLWDQMAKRYQLKEVSKSRYKLILKNLAREDSKKHTLEIKILPDKVLTVRIDLVVLQKPQMASLSVISSTNSTKTLMCKIEGSPAPDVSWSLIPFSKETSWLTHHNISKLIESYPAAASVNIQQTNFLSVSNLTFNVLKTNEKFHGRYFCFGKTPKYKGLSEEQSKRVNQLRGEPSEKRSFEQFHEIIKQGYDDKLLAEERSKFSLGSEMIPIYFTQGDKKNIFKCEYSSFPTVTPKFSVPPGVPQRKPCIQNSKNSQNSKNCYQVPVTKPGFYSCFWDKKDLDNQRFSKTKQIFTRRLYRKWYEYEKSPDRPINLILQPESQNFLSKEWVFTFERGYPGTNLNGGLQDITCKVEAWNMTNGKLLQDKSREIEKCQRFSKNQGDITINSAAPGTPIIKLPFKQVGFDGKYIENVEFRLKLQSKNYNGKVSEFSETLTLPTKIGMTKAALLKIFLIAISILVACMIALCIYLNLRFRQGNYIVGKKDIHQNHQQQTNRQQVGKPQEFDSGLGFEIKDSNRSRTNTLDATSEIGAPIINQTEEEQRLRRISGRSATNLATDSLTTLLQKRIQNFDKNGHDDMTELLDMPLPPVMTTNNQSEMGPNKAIVLDTESDDSNHHKTLTKPQIQAVRNSPMPIVGPSGTLTRNRQTGNRTNNQTPAPIIQGSNGSNLPILPPLKTSNSNSLINPIFTHENYKYMTPSLTADQLHEQMLANAEKNLLQNRQQSFINSQRSSQNSQAYHHQNSLTLTKNFGRNTFSSIAIRDYDKSPYNGQTLRSQTRTSAYQDDGLVIPTQMIYQKSLVSERVLNGNGGVNLSTFAVRFGGVEQIFF